MNTFSYRAGYFLLIIFCFLSFANCSLFKGGKGDGKLSGKTSWKYNDLYEGGYFVSEYKEQPTGPGLVFVEGGYFTMGGVFEDPMYEWNSLPRDITVSSFYIDETEISNIDYREYLNWLKNVFEGEENASIIEEATPDPLVWREELSYNEPWVKYYFEHPAYNLFPVVGVSWKQATDYSIWRTNRVNEIILVRRGYLGPESIEAENLTALGGTETFDTESYLTGQFEGSTGEFAYDDDNPLKTPNGDPRIQVQISDGIILPDYRLPIESEWEYAAYALKYENYDPSNSSSKRGEELIASKHLYSWADNKLGLRYKGANDLNLVGVFQANLKRGRGDYMGISGGLNDFGCPTTGVKSFYPNDLGIYNMSGNVSEWVMDVYRPLTGSDGNDLNLYRGNIFKEYDLSSGELERNEKGQLKKVIANDEDVKDRRNYNKNYLVDYRDGDSITKTNYGYGITTLIGDNVRVVKGGSWADMPYYLVPSTRRYLEEDLSSNTIGFRCAMIRLGGQKINDPNSGFDFDRDAKYLPSKVDR